jgi:hypothetical protein
MVCAVLGALAGLWIPAAAGQGVCVPQWSTPIPTGELDGVVFAAQVWDAGDGNGPALYVAGSFVHAKGVIVNKIVAWNGTAWLPLRAGGTVGLPQGGGAFALAVFDDDGPGPNKPALFVGGSFTDIGALNVNNIAKWNGTNWSRLAEGVLPAAVWALAVHDEDPNDTAFPALFVGGTFQVAGTTNARRIAKWSGSAWSQLGEGMDNGVYALISFDDDGPGPEYPGLYAAGGFQRAGGTSANRVARWNRVGQNLRWWSLNGPIFDGVNNTAWALGVHDVDGGGPKVPSLFVGGNFTSAGGNQANRIAEWSWDGVKMVWSPLGTGIPEDNRTVWSLASFDVDADGSAPAELHVGGNFTMAGGVTVNNIGKWNGSVWSALGTGVDGDVRTLTVFDDDANQPNLPGLFVGGELTSAGGKACGNVAKWSCIESGDPRGDANCDGTINFADINPFVLALSDPDEYRRQYPSCDINNCDINRDGQINFADINPFVECLENGQCT